MGERCVLVRPTESAEGVTGLTYAAGISAATAGAHALSLELATLPPGARSRPHLHEGHESAAYVIEGAIVMWSGDALEDRLTAGPGDFVYIPAGVPHAVANASEDAPAVAVLARTDPAEQESVVALPELEAILETRR